MAEVDWGLIAPRTPATDYQTALHNSAVDDDLKRKMVLAQQKATWDQQAREAAQARYDEAAAAAARGDYSGAIASTIATGDPAAITAVTGGGKAVWDHSSDGVKAAAGAAQQMIDHVPDVETRRAIILQNKAQYVALGILPENIDALAANPSDENLRLAIGLATTPVEQWKAQTEQQNADSTTMNAQTAQTVANNPVVVAPGGYMVDRQGNPLFNAPQVVTASPTDNVYQFNGSSRAPGSVTAEQLYHRGIKPQESGGQPNGGAGAVGPQTKYGRAIGASQMLPATAQAMAAKLGIPYRADLMAAKTPEGLAYQDRLGIAYTQTALDASGGDPRKAAEYYFAGPNMALHGPKTASYGQSVMGRLGRGGSQPVTRTPQVIQQGQPKDGPAGPTGLSANASRQDLIRAIAEGRVAPPNPRTAQGQQLLQEVTAYDPTFDAANAATRVRTRINATSGQMAMARTALNTSIGHLMHLDEQAKKLGNFSVAPGILNPMYNSARDALGNKELPAFEQTKQAAASEMRKVFAGSGGGSLTELEEWQRDLSSSKSYEQLHRVIQNGVILMNSRLVALRQQYSEGMGRSDTTPRFITDDNMKRARALGVSLDDGPAPKQTAAGQPVRVNSPQEAMSLPKGTVFITPDGRKKVR